MYTDFSAIKENVSQLDNPANFADEVKLHAATAHLAVIRQQMDQVCAVLRLRMTMQMMQLARRFRQHFRHHHRIPTVNLDFGSSMSVDFLAIFLGLRPTLGQSAPALRQRSVSPLIQRYRGSSSFGPCGFEA